MIVICSAIFIFIQYIVGARISIWTNALDCINPSLYFNIIDKQIRLNETN